MKYTILFITVFLLFSCYENPLSYNKNYNINDIALSESAIALKEKLSSLNSSALFGQANARTLSASIYNTKNSNIDQSDCKDITGYHPAFIESDFMWYDSNNFRSYDLDAMILHYEEGGVIGYGWHFRDEEGSFYSSGNNNSLLSNIISDNNGKREWFYNQIDTLALPELLRLKELNIPVIIRPFHEMNGSWFWWGGKNGNDYINLYRLFVDYLRDTNELDNLLFAWSPNIPFDISYYPGDSYVDIIGLDIYEPTASYLSNQLDEVTSFANQRGKISAITETGYRNGSGILSDKDFWTAEVLEGVLPHISSISYIMSWYNANWGGSITQYTPYSDITDSEVISNFISFQESSYINFLNEE